MKKGRKSSISSQGQAVESLQTSLPGTSSLEQSKSKSSPAKSSALEDKLAEIHPDELSPRDALTLLYELKEAART